MTPVKHNVIHNLITTLHKIENTITKIEEMPTSTSDAASLKQQCIESLKDVDAELCHLVSDLTNSPLNGKLFVPLPQHFESAWKQETSVNFQLLPHHAVP